MNQLARMRSIKIDRFKHNYERTVPQYSMYTQNVQIEQLLNSNFVRHHVRLIKFIYQISLKINLAILELC